MNSPAAVAIADLDGDGFSDVAVLGASRWLVNQPAGRILRVFGNSPDGFSAVESTDVGIDGALDVVAADFDDDGSRDLAVLRSNGKIQLLWAGAASARTPVAFDLTEISLPVDDTRCLAAADADGDGRPDLIVGTSTQNVCVVGSDDKRQWKAPVTANGFPASHVSVSDLDHDSQPDLVLTDFSSLRAAGGEQAGAGGSAQDQVHILWGKAGKFDATRSTVLTATAAVATTTGDLDDDGRTDLVIAVHQSQEAFGGTSLVYYGVEARRMTLGSNGFATSGTTDVVAVPAENVLSARVVFCNSIGGRLKEAVPLRVYWGGATGFDAERLWEIPFQSGYEASAADLNADGFVDLISLNSGHAHAGDNGDGSLGANIFWGSAEGIDLQRRRSVIHEHFLGTSSVADLNRDGWLDLVLEPFAPAADDEVDRLFIYYGAPDSFDGSGRVSLPKQGYSQEHVVADFNDDGWLDVAHTPRHFNTVRVLWGAASGFDADRSHSVRVDGAMGLSTADLNSDGYLDLYVSTYADPVAGFRDMGSLILWGSRDGYRHSNAQWLPGFSPLGRTIADFDADGYLDLFSPQHSGELTREDLACHLYWGSADGFATRRRTTLICDSVNDSVAGDFDGDGRLDLAVACHTRHGDHRTHSRVFYNDGRRFENPRLQKLPTQGTHLMWALDVGHIADRTYRQRYISSAFAWDASATSISLTARAEVPPGTSLTFEVRAATTPQQLNDSPWTAISDEPVPLDSTARCLQYRALFHSDNGDRFSVLDRVELVRE